MKLSSRFIWDRALQAFTQRTKIHAIALVSLTTAFVFFGCTLIGCANLNAIVGRWGHAQRVSIFLKHHATKSEVLQLQRWLSLDPQIKRVRYVSAMEAAAEFGRAQTKLELPPEVFPDSIELELRDNAANTRTEALYSALRDADIVADIETYQGLTKEFSRFVNISQSLSFTLGILIFMCIIAIVASTVRLSLTSRRAEVEIMRLCGATNRFIRLPFLIEGSVQGFVAAAAAICILSITYIVFGHPISTLFQAMTGVSLQFLGWQSLVILIVTGVMSGAIASAWSIRRYLEV
jgi:cell division transport system permease protein